MRKGSKSFVEGGCGGRDSMWREHYIVEVDGQVRSRNSEPVRDYYIKRGWRRFRRGGERPFLERGRKRVEERKGDGEKGILP